MPSAQKDQTHKTKPKKNQKIKRTISNMRRKAPPLPAVRHKGSGAKMGKPGNREIPKTLGSSQNQRAEGTHHAKRQKNQKNQTHPPKRNTLGVNNKGQRYKTKSVQKGKRDTQGGWKVEMARPNWKTSNSEAIRKRQENQNLTSGNCRGMTYFLSQKQWVIHIFRIAIGRFRMKRHPNSSI